MWHQKASSSHPLNKIILKIQGHPYIPRSSARIKSASSRFKVIHINQDHPQDSSRHPQDSRSSIYTRIIPKIQVGILKIQGHPYKPSSSYPLYKIILKIQVGLIMLGSWRVGWGVQSCRMRLSPIPNGSDVRVCQDIASCTCYGLW